MYLGGGAIMSECVCGGGRRGRDRQPVPSAKLFCLRFCGRIGFVARFTLTLDKHFVFGLGLDLGGRLGGREGGEVRRGPPVRAIIPHRPERPREELLYPVLRPRLPPQELCTG